MDIWDEAFQNTKTIISYCKYIGVKIYKKGCRACDTTQYIHATRESQVLGNNHQRIVICKCSRPFVKDYGVIGTYYTDNDYTPTEPSKVISITLSAEPPASIKSDRKIKWRHILNS